MMNDPSSTPFTAATSETSGMPEPGDGPRPATDRQPVALVTGASSGIGLAIVVALAADGWTVVATLPDTTRGAALGAAAEKSRGVEIRQLDVTDEVSVERCVADVLAAHGQIELLVNNAGVGLIGPLEHLPLEAMAATMDVNYWGVVRMTRAVLPSMRTAGQGRILTISSMNGLVALPFADAYNASKSAVEGLMEGLAPVAARLGIQVVLVEPAAVRTPFFANTRTEPVGEDPDDPYGPLLEARSRHMAAAADDGQDPADVGAFVAGIARVPNPHLRYQTSDVGQQMAAHKLADPTGDSIVAATSQMLES